MSHAEYLAEPAEVVEWNMRIHEARAELQAEEDRRRQWAG